GTTPTATPIEPTGSGASGASGTDDLLSGSGDQPSESPVSSGETSGASGTDDLSSSGSGDQPSGSPVSSGDSSGASSTDELSSSGSGDQPSESFFSSGDSSGASGTDDLSGSGSGDQPSESFFSSGDSSGASGTDSLSGSGSGDQPSGSFVSSGDFSGAIGSRDLPSGSEGSSGSGSGLDIQVTFSGSDSVLSEFESASGRPQEAGTQILTFPFGQGSGLFGLDTSGSGSGSGSGYSSEESGSTSDFSSSSGESDESGDLSGISSGSGSSEESSGFSGSASGIIPSGGSSGISFIDSSGVIMVDSPWVKVSTAPHLTKQELGGSHVEFSGSGHISGSGMSGDISGMSGDASGMSGDIPEVGGVHSGSGSGSEFSGMTFLGSGFIDLTEQPREQEASGLLIFGSGERSGFTSGGFAIESGERSGESASQDIIFFSSNAMEMSNTHFQGMELGRGEVEYSGTDRFSSGSGDDASEGSGESASGDTIFFSKNAMVDMSNTPVQGMELGRGEVEYSGTDRFSSGSGDNQSAYASERSGESASGDIIVFSNNAMAEISKTPVQGMELGRGEVEYSGTTVRLSSGSGDDRSAYASVEEHEWIPVTDNTPTVNSSDAPSAVLSAQGPSGLYSDAAGPPVSYSEPEGITSKPDTVTSAALSSTTEPTSLQSPSVTEGHVGN
ncbi:hypothetical protein M9458_015768, partial [Cirrhinus mrigala]